MMTRLARVAVVVGLLCFWGTADGAEPDEIFRDHEPASLSEAVSAPAEARPQPRHSTRDDADRLEPGSYWEPVSFAPPSSGPVSGPPPPFPTVKLTGFFQADAAWFAQDRASEQAVGDILVGVARATPDCWPKT